MDQEFKLETAACLWEAMLDLLARAKNTEGKPDDTDLHRISREWVDGNGYSDVRMTVIGYTDECTAAWAKLDEFDGCYDWDFVPDFLHDKLSAWFGLSQPQIEGDSWLDHPVGTELSVRGKVESSDPQGIVLRFPDWSLLAIDGGNDELKFWKGKDVHLIVTRTEDGLAFARRAD